jgi:hypothetical protein
VEVVVADLEGQAVSADFLDLAVVVEPVSCPMQVDPVAAVASSTLAV